MVCTAFIPVRRHHDEKRREMEKKTPFLVSPFAKLGIPFCRTLLVTGIDAIALIKHPFAMHLYSLSVCRMGDDQKEAVRLAHASSLSSSPHPREPSRFYLRSAHLARCSVVSADHHDRRARALLLLLLYARLGAGDVHLLRTYICLANPARQPTNGRLSRQLRAHLREGRRSRGLRNCRQGLSRSCGTHAAAQAADRVRVAASAVGHVRG